MKKHPTGGTGCVVDPPARDWVVNNHRQCTKPASPTSRELGASGWPVYTVDAETATSA
jgi:hypothetical protein